MSRGDGSAIRHLLVGQYASGEYMTEEDVARSRHLQDIANRRRALHADVTAVVTHPTDASEGLPVSPRSRGTGNRASADGDDTLVLQRGRAQRTGQRLVRTNPTYQAVPSPKGDVPCVRRRVPMHYSTPVPFPTTDQSGCPLAYSPVGNAYWLGRRENSDLMANDLDALERKWEATKAQFRALGAPALL